MRALKAGAGGPVRGRPGPSAAPSSGSSQRHASPCSRAHSCTGRCRAGTRRRGGRGSAPGSRARACPAGSSRCSAGRPSPAGTSTPRSSGGSCGGSGRRRLTGCARLPRLPGLPGSSARRAPGFAEPGDLSERAPTPEVPPSPFCDICPALGSGSRASAPRASPIGVLPLSALRRHT